MKVTIEISGKTKTVEIARINGRLSCAIDGAALEADAVEITPRVYSILIGRESFEALVEPGTGSLHIHVANREYSATVRDPRAWRRKRGGGLELEGRVQVLAPMPGKIIRVLVPAGNTIEAGQGVAVVEAMKMQNEVRSPKTGKVERIFVEEGQTVNAGDVLATVA